MLDLPTLLDRARSVALDVAAPLADRTDVEARWPEEAMRALGEADLLSLVVPAALGGQGAGLAGLTRVCEILGQSCASTAITFGLHSVATAVLAARASPDQIERYVTPIVKGRHVTSLSLSEPGIGADFFFPHCTLRRDGDALVLTGTKVFVTNGGRADSYVVSAASGHEETPGMFSCVVVPHGTEGMRWGKPWSGLGMRGNGACDLALDDVRVRAGDLLGEEGDQLWFVFHVIAPHFLAALSGAYLGVAQAALDDAVNYVRSRRRIHGSRLSQLAIVQHRLGTMWAAVERTRRLIYHAAAEGDADPTAGPALFAAKAEVADNALAVVNDAMTLCGGTAYRGTARLGRLLRDVRAAPVMSPTTDMLRIWTGRMLLGEPLVGD